jgi:hypothetical protein
VWTTTTDGAKPLQRVSCGDIQVEGGKTSDEGEIIELTVFTDRFSINDVRRQLAFREAGGFADNL